MQAPRVTAVLGPTNTGKTHYAIERMLAHSSGVIGLPLRLLAREVYDRIRALRGPSVVALVTGEERIVPERAAYWVCTVEAMPQGLGADFLAIDEIQLCADPERGHVFTDRLLGARGQKETLFLGADTMRGAIRALVPDVEFAARDRFSRLTYTGAKKISRLAPRSAVVGFSVDGVYATAELLRRQKGGAAVVMGALSPRTRNAQVELYQNGDVDFLVATDAIGMGLNLDIRHVAFSSTTKFDGNRMRPLIPSELAQIAGRAGRHMTDGSFGVTGEANPLDEETASAIEDSRFAPVRKLHWRNARLDFATIQTLIGSLEKPTDNPWLTRSRESDDLLALRSLSTLPEISDRARGPRQVQLLWDICRTPDFRGISTGEHASLLSRLYEFLHQGAAVPDDWLARQVRRIDRQDGDIDTLSKRLAFIRTWTYVAQRKGWVDDVDHWRGATRAVEDRLSDALHARLTQRFVDRRTSVLMRRLKQKEGLVADVNEKGEVTVGGEFIGRLEGFRFALDKSADAAAARTLSAAAQAALAPELHLRADRFYNAPDTEMDFTEQGGLMWGEHAVGKLVAGSEPLKPQVRAFVDDFAGTEVAEKVARRLQHFIDRKIATLFEPLMAMQKDEELAPLARGFAYRMVEGLGIVDRRDVAGEVKELDQNLRGALRKHGVRFGQFTIFVHTMLKPAPTRLRLVLWSLAQSLDEFPESPPPGLVSIPMVTGLPEGTYVMGGYRPSGRRAIRIDMLERLADMIRPKDTRGGFEANPDMLSITGMTLEQFADLMQGLGYAAERGERQKKRVHAQLGPKITGDEIPVDTAQPPDTPQTQGDTPVPDGEAPTAEAATSSDTTEPEAQVEPQASAQASAQSGAEAGAETDVQEGSIAPRDDTPPLDPDKEIEVFYTFRWAPRRSPARQGDRAQGDRAKGDRGRSAGQGQADHRKGRGKPHNDAKGKPRGKGGPRSGGPGKGGKRDDRAKTYTARPPKKEKAIDPDNPFAAALMGLKDKS